MSGSGILTVHLRGLVPEGVLRDELAKLFGLQTEQLAPLELATPATVVPYQYTPRERGFLVSLDVYAGQAPVSGPASDIALARHLSKRLGQDALISPLLDTGNPYLWLLVRPDGTTSEVAEIPSDDNENGIVIAYPDD